MNYDLLIVIIVACTGFFGFALFFVTKIFIDRNNEKELKKHSLNYDRFVNDSLLITNDSKTISEIKEELQNNNITIDYDFDYKKQN